MKFVVVFALCVVGAFAQFRPIYRTGHLGLRDCLYYFSTPDMETFCTAFVGNCSEMVRAPHLPKSLTCGGCYLSWLGVCPHRG